LVDIDLDCGEALMLADTYLPPTEAIFGRASKPRSHRLYIAPGALFEAFSDPLEKDMLVELRTSGNGNGAHQTILPPTIVDGERREWYGDIVAPAGIVAAALRTSTAWLAVGCLVARHLSLHAAQRPGPDLPTLLAEADPELGRSARRWLRLPDPEKPRPHL